MEETNTGGYWKRWAKAAGIRALRTMAQGAIVLIPAGASITEVNWLQVLGVIAATGIVSLLMSLAGLPEVDGLPGHEHAAIEGLDRDDVQALAEEAEEEEL